MEEIFEFSDDKNSFTIRVYDIQINSIIAYNAEYKRQDELQYSPYKDLNDMIYYFIDKEFLRQRIIEFLTNLSSTSDDT